MRKFLIAVSFLAFFLPSVTSAAIFCPQLTQNMKQGYCDQYLDDPDCLAHVTGDQVSQLQHFLKDYYSNPTGLRMSGYFGPKTKQYVIKFQSEWDLPATGNVFGLTRAAIKEACTPTGTTPPPQPPPPTPPTISCNLSVSPSTITEGQSATLSWTSNNAYSGLITPGVGYVTPSGSQSVSVLQSTTFQGTFYGTGPTGQVVASCSTNLTVTIPGTANQSCTLDGQTVLHGNSWTFYNRQTGTSAQCAAAGLSRTCTNGTLSGDSSYQYSSCSFVGPPDPNPNQSCTTPWGGTVQNGSSVTAYQSSSVPAGQQCVSESRLCTNGSLGGSFQYQSCAPLTAGQPFIKGTAPLAGQTIRRGEIATFSFNSFPENTNQAFYPAYIYLGQQKIMDGFGGYTYRNPLQFNVPTDFPLGPTTVKFELHANGSVYTDSYQITVADLAQPISAGSCKVNGQDYPEGTTRLQQHAAYGDLYFLCDNSTWVVSPQTSYVPGIPYTPNYTAYIYSDICEIKDSHSFKEPIFSTYGCVKPQLPYPSYSVLLVNPRHGNRPLSVDVKAFAGFTSGKCAAFTINWGDGSQPESVPTYNCNMQEGTHITQRTHSYATAGSYTLSFTAVSGYQHSANIRVAGPTASADNQTQLAAALTALESALKSIQQMLGQ